MGMFNGECNTSHKAKKRIHQLKRELAALTGENKFGIGENKFGGSNWMNADFNAGEMAGVVKEKGQQAYDSLSEHAEVLKDKAKENPKTALAILAGVGLAACLLMRRN